jgi:LPS O-antigen subunit length determinant protein (WzzB/FepE family)
LKAVREKGLEEADMVDPEDIKMLLTNSVISVGNSEIQKKIESLKSTIIITLRELSLSLQEMRRNLNESDKYTITQLSSLNIAFAVILKVG